MYDTHYVKKSEKHEQRKGQIVFAWLLQKDVQLTDLSCLLMEFFHPIHGVERAKVTTIYLDTRFQ